ncbi:MAG: fatty acid desaturase [Planctomycetota bacterium]
MSTQAATATPPANPHRFYATAIRPMMPKEAFKRSPRKLVPAIAHLLIVVAAWVAARYLDWWAWPILGIVAGHSMACLAFLAHELSHNAILKRGKVKRVVETGVMGLLGIPSTMWHEVHNITHHGNTNTPDDPDRRWMTDEVNKRNTAISAAFHPQKSWYRFSPLVPLQFVGYIMRNIIAALSGGHWGTLPAAPKYDAKQRRSIAIELGVIVLIQALAFTVVGFDWVRWLLVGPFAWAVASSVVMAYVFTNHFLHPIHDESDPVGSSTSVIVPRWVDAMHFNFSYHTEHHLFPGMDSKWYPEVSRNLREQFPDRYNQLPFLEAWRRLLAAKMFEPAMAEAGGESPR